MNNKGNYADEIDTKMCRLKVITGTLEMEYSKPRADSEQNREYVKMLDAFALGLSSILTDTILKMSDSWPVKLKDLTPESMSTHCNMAMSMEVIHDFNKKIQPDS